MKKGHTSVVVGSLWGDEGKGRLGAYLAYNEDYDIAVRAGTGTNAGHSLYRNGKIYKTNQLPLAGIFPNKSGKKMILAVGSGVCVDPEKLENEIRNYELYYPKRKVIIDRLCTIIESKHKEREAKGENYSESHTGSTKSGSGEARVDRVKRIGNIYNQFICDRTWDYEDDILVDNAFSENVAELLNKSYDEGKKIIVEGTQAYSLSLYLSEEYPVVTSDNCTASAFIDDVGLSWNRVDDVYMAIKSAPTRVSQDCGHLFGELSKEQIKDLGIEEYGVTTGRLRRKSLTIPFDLLEESIMINSPTYFALTFCNNVDTISEELPEYVTKDWIKKNMPNTFLNIEKLEEKFQVPVKYIDYGKELFDILEVK